MPNLLDKGVGNILTKLRISRTDTSDEIIVLVIKVKEERGNSVTDPGWTLFYVIYNKIKFNEILLPQNPVVPVG
jgi:hypothetical protein